MKLSVAAQFEFSKENRSIGRRTRTNWTALKKKETPEWSQKKIKLFRFHEFFDCSVEDRRMGKNRNWCTFTHQFFVVPVVVVVLLLYYYISLLFFIQSMHLMGLKCRYYDSIKCYRVWTNFVSFLENWNALPTNGGFGFVCYSWIASNKRNRRLLWTWPVLATHRERKNIRW